MADRKPTADVTPDPDEVARTDSGAQAKTTVPLSEVAADTADFEMNSVASPQATNDFQTLDFMAETCDFSSRQPMDGGGHSVRVPGYEILGELGRGAMGVVYKARQIRADRIVALKVMLNIDHARPQELQRFLLEAQAAAQLQHPSIVQVYDVGEVGELPYFTQEFVDGGTLAQRLAKTTMQPAMSASMLLELAEGVSFAHSRGVVHRDLKPSNVLITADGSLKIADFGLARRMEDQTHLTKDGTILGTPSYMAPEQAYGSSHEIGPLSDVYTLGAILYEFLVGRPPFKGATAWEVIEQVRTVEPVRPSEIERGVPKDLETICLKCLQKEPEKRYSSARELADDLQRYLNNEPILARPIGRIERVVRLCRRHPAEARLIGLVTGLLLMLAIGAVWTALRINADRNEIRRKQVIADQRLASRNKTIFEVVNRLPQSLQAVPFSDAAMKQLAQLSEELLQAEETLEAVDSEIGPSRQWGLLAIELRQGEVRFNHAMDLPNEEQRDQELHVALTHFQRARDLAQTVYDSGEGDRAKAAGNLGAALTSLAGVQAKLQMPEFETTFRRAVQLREEALANEHSLDSHERKATLLAYTLHQYAKALDGSDANNSTWETKRSLFDRAIKLYEGAVDQLDEQSANKVRDELCNTLNNAAILSMQASKSEAALAHFQSAIAGYEQLCQRTGNELSTVMSLIRCYGSLGDYLLTLNRPAEARKQYVNIVRYLHIVQMDARFRELNGTWAMAYYRLGMAALAENNPERVQKYFSRAVEIRQTPLKQREDIEGKSNGDALWVDRIELMLAQAWAGQVEQSRDMARRLVARYASEKNEDANLALFSAATALGIVSTQVEESERPAMQQEAIAALRLAVAAGFDELTYAKNDLDVAPLRAIPGFEEALNSTHPSQHK